MQQPGKHSNGAPLVLFAAILWGTTGTAQAFAPAGFDSVAVGTLRLVLGGAALLTLALAGGGLGRLRDWPAALTIAAAFFTAAYQVCFFAGVAKTGVAVGTIVGIGSAPVAAGILDVLVHRRAPGRRWSAATLLAVGGCTLLGFSGGGEVVVDPLGILLAIGAGVSYAAYTLFIKRLLADKRPDAVMAVVFCLGAVLLLPLLPGRELAWIFEARGAAVVLHLGLVTAALAYWLFARGLQKINASSAVTLSLAEPLTAGLLGVTVLGEQLNASAALGIVLILGGLLLLSLPLPALRRPKRQGAA